MQHYAQGGQIKGLVFSVEEGWMDLDGMQSSMKSHLCHRHNILATWDAWGFDVTVPHPARNSIGLAGGSKREEKKMPCAPFSQAEEERLQRLGTQDKDDRSSSRKKTLLHYSKADVAAIKGAERATSESLLYISSSILKHLWRFSLSQTFVESFKPGWGLLHSGSGDIVLINPTSSQTVTDIIPEGLKGGNEHQGLIQPPTHSRILSALQTKSLKSPISSCLVREEWICKRSM